LKYENEIAKKNIAFPYQMEVYELDSEVKDLKERTIYREKQNPEP
jgi:hypothetical protein